MTTINSVNSATPNSSLPDALDTGHLELGMLHAAQPNPSPSLSPNPNPHQVQQLERSIKNKSKVNYYKVLG